MVFPMDDHLHAVHSIWRGQEEGAWLGIDFSKAFDSTSHCLMSAFLIEIGVPTVWVHILKQFLRGPIQTLVGNQITGAELVPGSGIEQGDTLSPTLFSLLTALLVHKIKLRFPEMRSFLYADDTLVFIPGSLPTVRQGLQGLRELLTHYGEVSGYKLNRRKCGVVLQGIEWNITEVTISGFNIQRNMKYLGTLLGNATVMEQFQGPLAKLHAKAQFLAALSLTECEKVQALHLWAYPVLRHMALQFFPTPQVIRWANMAMRTALQVRNWDLPVSCWQQPRDKGGYTLGTAGDYMLWVHSQVFAKILRLGRDHPKTTQNFQVLESWFSKRTKLPLTDMQLKYLAWSKLPQVHWPLPITSSVAYSCF